MSPNPSINAMHALMGNGGMSKVSDAPLPNKLSEPVRAAAEKMKTAESAQTLSVHSSPVSLPGFSHTEGTGASTALTSTTNDTSNSGHFVAEPAQMTESGSYPGTGGGLSATVTADEDDDAAADKVQSYTYPGPPPQSDQSQEGPSRGMSLPMSGYGQNSPKSPTSNKRHKCPYCSTDFTRHHNLKSHLLTHSQEKPYVCQTCQSRFRRLHDLKRHTKLHTGERPHTCDKCGRRFARGDALARHNKGPGGCAGRRSSFGGDEDGDGGVDGMDGIDYTGGDGDEDDEDSADPHGRRGSEPSRKRTHLEAPNDGERQVYRQHSSTYPPPLQSRSMRNGGGTMGPPTVVQPHSSTTSPRDMSSNQSPAGGTSISSAYYGAPAGQAFAQSGAMTESPKPLSPGQSDLAQHHRLSVSDPSAMRNRSPSLTSQFQHAHFGRSGGRGTPPTTFSHASHSASHAPQLPSLPGLSSQQPPGRVNHAPPPSQMGQGPGPSMLHHQQLPPTTQPPGAGSQQGSLSSHGHSSGSSMQDVIGRHPDEIWNYVRSLEQRFSRMQDEYELRISRLQEEVIGLKSQMSSNQASYSSDMGQRY